MELTASCAGSSSDELLGVITQDKMGFSVLRLS